MKMHARGIVNEKLYCEKCVLVADDYSKQRDELHTRLAKEWSDGLAALSTEFADTLKVLPDG
jgi:hypothetical protein